MNAARFFGTRCFSTLPVTGASRRGFAALSGSDEGKVEFGVKYVRRNFLCGLLGREPANLADLNSELRRWVAEVANRRVHSTTREQVLIRWDEDQFNLPPVKGHLPDPYADDEQRKVARDAYVSWHGSRYSVPWRYAGREVWVREQGRDVEVRCGAELIARHASATRSSPEVSITKAFRLATSNRPKRSFTSNRVRR
jgi:hypothetical protein